MKSNLYLCVDLKTRTQVSSLQLGEGRKGMLTMTEDGEKFEFDEQLRTTEARNMRVYKGSVVNVSKSTQGFYRVNMRFVKLTEKTNPKLLARLFKQDLEEAMKELGM